MECEEIRVDLRTIPHSADRQRSAQLLFRLNHTLPFSEEYNALLRELLGKNLGEGSTIAPPLSGATLDMLKIGRGVFVNSNLLAMARGGITIGDHARIAANVQLLSNNHDPYDLDVLTCKAGGDRGLCVDRRRRDGAARCARGAARRHRRGLRGHEGCAGLCRSGREPRAGYQNAGQRKNRGLR